MCHIRFDAGFPDADLDAPSSRVRHFVGFATQASLTQRFLQADHAVKFQGPLLFAAGLPNSDQAITEKAAPARWTEVNATQSHPVGAVYYLLRHHCPNFWALFDFHFDSELNTLRRGAFGFQDTVLASQLGKVAAIARATLGCRSDSTLVLRRKP